MILKASQRGGGLQLARHLMNDVDNDHVELHEVRGFVASSLQGAFKEAHAVSRGTRCRQFLFSVSLNPPETERVPIEAFETAISAIEERMGLSGQPRAIIFHEKEGRRHAHAVWSRIDAGQMKAINLPHYKLKLRDLSRQLYLDHGWKLPNGLMNSQARDPLNFTLAEWQQARRVRVDPRQIKEALQECWAVSDSRQAFESALAERGYYLAQGDRRGHVTVDWRGDVYAVSRWVGVKAKEVPAKLRDSHDLPAVEEVKCRLAQKFTEKLKTFVEEERARQEKAMAALLDRKKVLVHRQRRERQALRDQQISRRNAEISGRSGRLPRGVKAVWWKITDKWRQAVREIEREAQACDERDQVEYRAFINQQLAERRHSLQEIRQLKDEQSRAREVLDRDVAEYFAMSHEAQLQTFEARTESEQTPRSRASRSRGRC